MSKTITTNEAVSALKSLIDDCDGDTLTALYEYAFANVENAIFNDDSITFDDTNEVYVFEGGFVCYECAVVIKVGVAWHGHGENPRCVDYPVSGKCTQCLKALP
ncbi:MAG: hypothetical protein ACXAEN_23210 [Candidatus Thorarchaeota archaeon]|jgi:hypothetical protein